MAGSHAIDDLKRASILAPSTIHAIKSADQQLQQQIADFVRQSDLLGAHFRASEFTALGGLPNISIVQKAIGDFHARFELPDLSVIRQLVEQFETNSIFANEALRFNQTIREMEASMGAMRVAWLDNANALQSMQGFAELQGIGRAVRTCLPLATASRISFEHRWATGEIRSHGLRISSTTRWHEQPSTRAWD